MQCWGFSGCSPSALLHTTVCSAGVSMPFTLYAVICHCVQYWGFYTVHPLHCCIPVYAVLGFLWLFTLSAVIRDCMQCWGFYTVHLLCCYTPLCAGLGFLWFFTLSAVIHQCMQCWGFYTVHPLHCYILLHAVLAGALLACNHPGDSSTFQQAACSHTEVHSINTALWLSEWDSVQLLLFLNVSHFSLYVKCKHSKCGG